MSSRSTVLLSAFAAVSSAFAANTWYVDDDNYNSEYTTYSDYENAGYDGKDEPKAFGTIQIAVDKASYGDKIIVLPGTYDKGLKDVNMDKSSFRARIYVSKGNLWIEAKEGKAVTHIVGAPDPDTEDGIGPKAAKCVHIGASGVVFQGFTFRGGRSGTTDDDSSWASRGCAV